MRGLSMQDIMAIKQYTEAVTACHTFGRFWTR
jgi:hypothetical protein